MRLTATTVVAHPETNEPTVLLEGSDLPAWAKGLVGDHLLEAPEPAPKAAPKAAEK